MPIPRKSGPRVSCTSPPRLCALDVVLVRGTGTLSTAQCAAQSLRFGRKVSFSHVVLGVQPGVYLHSTPHAGVHFARPSDIWGASDYTANKLVLRSKELHKGLTLFEIIDAAIEYANSISGAHYNYLISFPEGVAKPVRRFLGQDESALFCSELAAKILQDNRAWKLQPEQTWPGHFELEHGDWEDVTPLHTAFAELYKKGSDLNCSDIGAKYCFDATERDFEMCQALHSLKLGNRKLLRETENIWRRFQKSVK